MTASHRISLTCSIFIAVFVLASGAIARRNLRVKETELPGPKTVLIPSPDGRWLLIAPPANAADPRTLILEDRSSGKRTVVRTYDRSAGIGWSPDGRSYFLNDAYGSNGEDAFVYWPDQANPLPLSEEILKTDSDARHIQADHAYFQVRRWLGSDTLLAEYCGHNSGPPYQQFDFLYQVTITGPEPLSAAIHKLSGSIGPLSLSAADCRPQSITDERPIITASTASPVEAELTPPNPLLP